MLKGILRTKVISKKQIHFEIEIFSQASVAMIRQTRSDYTMILL